MLDREGAPSAWDFGGISKVVKIGAKTVDVADKSRSLDDDEEGSELQENQSPSRLLAFSLSQWSCMRLRKGGGRIAALLKVYRNAGCEQEK